MKRLKTIYAMLLAVVYITAVAMSSLSVFICDHDHLHHSTSEEAAHTHSCTCCAHTNSAQESYSCDHHHDLLSDNLTEYITSSERGTARHAYYVSSITDYATIATFDIDIAPQTTAITAHNTGYEATPPRAAFIAHESLRAPPYWV
ncbi:MAG: hypothetical protein IJX40_02520 [Alistipes sp.]|nr:hypothetical protein [Alistipes sp.]